VRRSRRPLNGAGELPPADEPEPQPERIAGRPRDVIVPEGLLVSPSEELRAFVGLANQLRGQGEMLEVVQIERVGDGCRRGCA